MTSEDNGETDLSKHDGNSTDIDVAGKEVAIQTNPHEIERNGGQLPLRKRFVPVRFSDYGIFADNAKEDDDMEMLEDSDFDPSENSTKPTLGNKDGKHKRSRGRPKRTKDTTTVSPSEDTDDPGQEAVKKNPIIKVFNGFKCTRCDKTFTLRGNAKTHLITHTNDRPFPCDFKDCDKRLRTKESLRRHKLSHLGVKTFQCLECHKLFSCNTSLQEHMATHTGEKPLTCGICGTKFRQIAVLRRHITTHSNEKPFACEVCGKRFSLKVYVRSHMKTHTGERPYACDVCNKCFAHASDLNRHKIIHSGKKPYQCSICPMRFCDPSSRRRHEREHETKPQCICHICKQQFPRAGQLRAHLIKEHTATPMSENSVLHFPYVEIDNADDQDPKLSSAIAAWARSVEAPTSNNTRVVNISPSMVKAAISSGSDPVDGEVSGVQIVLESSGTSQINKDLIQVPLSGEVNTVVQSGQVQTVVVELPQNADSYPSMPEASGTTYKVIDANNQVFEIQVDKDDGLPQQVPFQVQELNDQMKINVSDVKMQDGQLVAFLQNGNTVTVMEEDDAHTHSSNTSHLSSGNDSSIDKNKKNNTNLLVHSANHSLVVRDVGKESEDGREVVLESPNKDETEQQINIESVSIPTNLKDNLILISKVPASVDNSQTLCSSEGTFQSQADSNSNTSLQITPTPTYGNQNSILDPSQSVSNPTEFVDDIADDKDKVDISWTHTTADTESSVTSLPPSVITSPFIETPDLNSQDYYNWLSSFSEECKHIPLPLPKDVFTKISQVQKTLTDFMATPSGVITDKNNYKILMGITQELAQITSSHLTFMYSSLNS